MDLSVKIARLVEERGWNQEDLARIAGINRHTVREILKHGEGRRLRNDTVKKCAEALGLVVAELREWPLDKLLPRMRGEHVLELDSLKVLRERATQPELQSWVEQNLERAAQLSPEEADELIAIQGPNGPLVRVGVERYIELIERKRKLLQHVSVVAGTQYLCFLEQFVELLYEKVRCGAKDR